MSEDFLQQDAPPSSPPQDVEVDEEEEEEVDQLDSEGEPEPASPTSRSPSPVEREEGTSLLPVNKMEEIIHANATPNMLAFSKEALFLVSVATEEFVKKMTRSGLLKATAAERTAVAYPDMSYVTQQYQEFMFLQELIPAPITLAEALELRQEKEKEMILQDPALTVQAVPTPASSPPPSAIVRQLPPVPVAPASTSQSARAPRTRAKATNPKKTQSADPNTAPVPERDRSGVPQHMQHQMQMQLNGDFAPGPAGVSMQVDMSNSTVSRSSSRSTKGKRKETKPPASSKRRKTAPTPGSSTSASPPVSNGSRSTSITPANYMPPPPVPPYSSAPLDFAGPSGSSASAPARKKEANSIPSHLLDPALLNGGGSYTPSPPPTTVPAAASPNSGGAHWPIQADVPQPLNTVLGGGVGGRTIYSSNSAQR